MYMAESVLATMQRKQIEITIGELLLTDDFYMRLEITERLRHLIAHADPSLDRTRFMSGALEVVEALDLLLKLPNSQLLCMFCRSCQIPSFSVCFMGAAKFPASLYVLQKLPNSQLLCMFYGGCQIPSFSVCVTDISHFFYPIFLRGRFLACQHV